MGGIMNEIKRNAAYWIKDYVKQHPYLDDDNQWDIVYDCMTDEGTSVAPWTVYQILVDNVEYPDIVPPEEGWDVNMDKVRNYLSRLGSSSYQIDSAVNLEEVFYALDHAVNGVSGTSNLDAYLPDVYKLVNRAVDKDAFILYYCFYIRDGYPTKEELDSIRTELGV